MAELIGIVAGVAVGAVSVVALFVVLCRAKAAQKKLATSAPDPTQHTLGAAPNDVTTVALPGSSNKSDEELASNPPKQNHHHKSNNHQKLPRRSFLGFGGGSRTPPDEPHSGHDAESGDGGDQSSFSTLDYDYAKAYAGTSGGNSVVSSVGGTQGDNTQEDVPVLDSAVVGERAAALGVAAAATSGSTTDSASSLYNNDNSNNKPHLSPPPATVDGNSSVDDGLIYSVQVPVGQKLGLVVHSADGTNGDLPVVHAIKEDSVLIRKKVSVGDYLLRVDDVNVKGMSALEVSKWIRTPNNGGGTKTLTLMRPRRRPSLLSNPDNANEET